ncbi:MAG: acyltransferase [Proteobacteria bacterium]|nr:acyltransferase [Pseudomonadota bacterium]
MDKPNYRADIDGLRAIAVVSVILFHFGFDTFAGGFVGVDVFFVISGFLITRIIRDDVAVGRFNFPDFYMRRARRLFPALYFTVVVCFVAAYVVFSPQYLERFGGSIIHTVLGISNFYFWGESGYFDTDAVLKPLLHTWSLSIEEQFYLVWPALLVLLLKRKHRFLPPLFIVFAGALSLYFSERWLQSDEEGAFFLLPFRIVEFAFGALLVWLVKYQPRNKFIFEPLVFIGLALIAYSVFTYSDETDFPGLSVLVPCLGTTLLVYSGTAKYSGHILSNPVIAGVGKISYSLYLIHWPIFVFYKYYNYDELTQQEIIALLAVSLIVAVLMYRFVETPIRRGIRKKNHLNAPAFGFACAMLALLVSFPATSAWTKDGWPWRLPIEVRAVGQNLKQKRLMSWKYIKGADVPAKREFNPKLTNVLITGDSHAKDFFNAVYLNRERFEGIEFRSLHLDDECFYLFGGHAPSKKMKQSKHQNCLVSERAFKESHLLANAEYVLVSTRWNGASLNYLDDFNAYLKSRGVQLVLLSRTAEFQHVPNLVIQYGRLFGVDRFVASTRKTKPDRINRKLRRKAKKMGVRFKDKLSFICSKDLKSCDVIDEDNNLIFFDYGHWTLEGAKHFGRKIAETGFLSDLWS